VFASLIRLRYSQPDTPRAFTIPGGKAGTWLIGGMGVAGVVLAFVVGLMPPSYFPNAAGYVGAVLIGTFLLAAPPLVFLKMKKPEWMKKSREAP
jgi:hypothetical protein